jgi:hypothetical protein
MEKITELPSQHGGFAFTVVKGAAGDWGGSWA